MDPADTINLFLVAFIGALAGRAVSQREYGWGVTFAVLALLQTFVMVAA